MSKEKLLELILPSFEATLKEAAGELKHPYISPGGCYSSNLWDWDSYWSVFAMLKMSDKYGNAELKERIVPYARGVFFNFIEHQGEDGSLPILMTAEDDDWFDCKKSDSQNMAKPFLGQLTQLLIEYNLLEAGDLKETIYNIRAFHECYRRRYLHQGTGLCFWANDCGIGVDDDPSTWGRPEKSSGSIFLNTFLYKDYLAAAKVSEFAGRPDYAEDYRQRAEALKNSIQKYCYDKREKSFFSVDLQCRQNLYPHRYWKQLNNKLTPFWQCLPLKVLCWSSILPLWAGIGTQEQIDDFIREHFVPERLMSQYGMRSLSLDEPMYAPEVARGNPSNWLGPIWILSNYIAWDMLIQSGHREQADELADKITGLLYRDIQQSGILHEYYSPETGKGVANPNFMSWNVLAGLMV